MWVTLQYCDCMAGWIDVFYICKDLIWSIPDQGDITSQFTMLHTNNSHLVNSYPRLTVHFQLCVGHFSLRILARYEGKILNRQHIQTGEHPKPDKHADGHHHCPPNELSPCYTDDNNIPLTNRAMQPIPVVMKSYTTIDPYSIRPNPEKLKIGSVL